MTRSKSVIVGAFVGLLGLSFVPTTQAQSFAQSMGFGYGPGYNAPGNNGAGYNGAGQAGCQSCQAGYQPGYQGGGQNCQTCIPGGAPINPAVPFCSAQRGCCEIPANWRQHVWDGYRGDPCTWHTSFCGVPKPPGYGFGYGGKGGCPTCRPCSGQPAYGSAYATPASALQPIPSGPQPAQY